MMLKVFGALAMLAGALVAAAYMGQRRLMYFPDRTRTPPAAAGLTAVEEVVRAAPDGARIVHWWGRAQPGLPTLLYFHGNGGALVDRVERFDAFLRQGWGVLALSYRGYGGSQGSPTEADNVADAIRAFDFLTGSGLSAHDIVIYGESLGTGIAAQVASARGEAAGLILEAPYTSAVAVGQRQFPFLPVGLGMVDRYETERFIGDITMPLLILHGRRDRVIPVEMGRALARLAREPKTYAEFAEGGHDDLYAPRQDALSQVRAWIEQHVRVSPRRNG